MANQNQIKFGVGYEVDKASIEKVKQSLRDLQNIKIGDFRGTEEQLQNVQKTAKVVEIALQKAFNPTLNTANIETFNTILKQSGRTIDTVYADFAKLGSQGRQAFTQVASQVMTTNAQLRETKSLLTTMGETMVNTVKWGIASSVMNTFTNSVRQAFEYVKNLDSALTDIRIVTGDSTQKMKEFAVQANQAAQSLGRSTMDYTKAALTFYQQGLSDQDVQARTQATLVAQNITGAGQEMADYLTAVWNGYKVANEEAELYVDKLAAVADSSASNMSQLATAMSKVASTANMLGVPVDKLNAQIATITATTRQAPETVGNALKTIYARINDIATGADGAQISLGNYSEKMAQVGFSVLDANGKLRDTGDVIDEIGAKWSTLSREQQIYLARTMAGQRQYNNLLALFENWGRYTELVNVSMDAQGAAMEKNERYMDSLAAKMEQFGAAGEKVKSALVNENDLKGIVDFGTKAVDLFANLVKGIGGGGNAMLALGSIATSVFGNVIGKQIGNMIIKSQQAKASYQAMAEAIQNTTNMKFTSAYLDQNNKAFRNYVDSLQEVQSTWSVLTVEEKQQQQENAKNIALWTQQKEAIQANQRQVEKFVQSLAGNKATLENNFVGARDKLLQFNKELQVGQNILRDYFQNATEINFTTVLNNVTEIQERLGKDVTTLPFYQSLKNAANGINITNEEFDILINHLQQFYNQASKNTSFALNIQKSKNKVQELDSELQKLLLRYNQLNNNAKIVFNTQQIINFASGIGQIASSLNTIINLTKTWNNENISVGEKITQTLTSVGFMIPMIASGIKNIGSALGIVQVLQLKSNLLEQQKITSLAIEELLNISVNRQLTKEEEERLKILLLTKQQIIAENGRLSILGSIGNKLKGIGSTITGAISAHPIFAAISAATAFAIVVGVTLVKAWNSASQAAKKAAQVAEQASKKYDQIKQSYDNLKTSIQNYNSAQQAISEMTKGTQEWRDAIQESNDAILQLINNYPKLSKYVSSINGQLQLSEQGQRQALTNANRQVLIANATKYSTAAQARQAQNQLDALNLFTDSNGTVGAASRLVGPIASLLGVGSFGNSIDKSLEDSTLKIVQAYNNLKDDFGDIQEGNFNLVKAIQEQTGASEDLINNLLENRDKFDNLATAVEQNTAALKLSNQNIAAQILQDQEFYKNANGLDQQAMVVLGGEQYKELQDSVKQEYLGTIKDWSNIGLPTEEVKKERANILKLFSQAMGVDFSWDSNSVRHGSQNRTLAFRREGASEAEIYSAEYVASTIAAAQAMQQLGTSAKETGNFLNDLNNGLSDEQANAFKNFIAGNNLSSFTQSELSDLATWDKDTLLGVFSSFITPENFQQIFGEDIDTVLSNYHDYIQEEFGKFDTIVEDLNLNPIIAKAFKNLNLDNATYQLQVQIAEKLRSAFIQGGTEGLQNLQNFYAGISDISKLNQVVEQIDFTTASISDVKLAFAKAGIEISANDEAIQAWIDSLKQASNALQQITPQEKYKSLHDIADDFLKGTTTLTTEDAQILDKLGINYKKFFQEQADGTYELLSTAQEFYNYINNESLQGFKTKLQDITDELTFRQTLQNTTDNFDDFASGAYQYNEDTKVTKTQGQKLDLQLKYLQAVNDTVHLEESELETLRIAQDRREKHLDLTKDQLDKVSELVVKYKQYYENNEAAIAALEEEGIRYTDLLQNALDRTQQISKVLDPDIDEDQWKNLADYLEEYGDQIAGLDDHVIECRQDAEDLAQAILRFDAAMESVIEHYDTWESQLKSGSLTERIQAMNELQNVYSDLLDLPFENLSPDFTGSLENLQLLQQAVRGNERAYQDLLFIANQDILVGIGIDPNSKLYDDAMFLWEVVQDGLQDFEVGADLNGQPFLRHCEDLINAAGMTAEQATDYLASMGVNATVKENTAQATETQQVVSTIPTMDVQTMRGVNYYRDAKGRMQEQQYELQVPYYYYKTETETVPARKENKAFSLQIESAHKKSGGDFKFQQAPHRGSSIGSKTGNKLGNGSGGGGGSKGGGGSAKQPTMAKISTDTISTKQKQTPYNPYEEVEKSYERQEDLLKDLDKLEKHLQGEDRLNNIQQQNKELIKQNSIIEERQKISEDAAEQGTTAWYRNQLLADEALKDVVKFDPDGQVNETVSKQAITNAFNTQLAAQKAYYEAAQNSYNNWIENVWNKYSGEQQQANKKQKEQYDEDLKNAKKNAQDKIKLAEEEYNNRTKLLENYQKTLEEDNKFYEQYLDNIEKLIENRIAESKIKVDLAFDFGQTERQWQEFENKFIKRLQKDDIFANAKASFRELQSYFNSSEIAQAQKEIDKVRKEIALIQSGQYSSIYGITQQEFNNLSETDRNNLQKRFLDQATKDLQDYQKKLMNSLEEVQDKQEEIQELYLDSIDKAKDKMDDVISQYERINDLVEHNIKLTELLYGDNAGFDIRNSYYSRQSVNNSRMLENLRQQQAYWQSQLNNANPDSEDWKRFKENLENVTDAINAALENQLDLLATKFENKIQGALANIQNKLTNGLGNTFLDNQWEFINDDDEAFLDAVNSKFGIDEVEQLYEDAAAGAEGNIVQQQRINKLMNDQLKALREKDKLTQYDIDRAKAALEVEKARMALEDARNNKTKMRLRRDSQGNYTYQYVADEEKLSDLQSALADAESQLYNMDKEHYKQQLNEMYDTYKDYLERRADLEREMQATQDANERARIQARIKLLEETYTEYADNITGDLQYTLSNYLTESAAAGLGMDLSQYSTAEQIEFLKDNLPYVNTEIQNLADTITGEDGILNSTRQYLDELTAAFTEYNQEVQDTLSLAGTSVLSIASTLDDQAIAQTEQWLGLYEEAAFETQSIIENMQKLLEEMQKFMNEDFSSSDVIQSLYNAEQMLEKILNPDQIDENTILTGTSATIGYGTLGPDQDINALTDEQRQMLQSLQDDYLTQQADFNTLADELALSDINSYTENILANADEILDNIYNTYKDDLRNRLEHLLLQEVNSLADIINSVGVLNNSQTLDQNVTIEASFPNVTNHTEIEQALNNLVNMASQQAARQRP